MNPAKDSFANLFKKYRLKSGFATLSEFADALAQEGLIYEESLFSHWQKGDRIPKNRRILLIVLTVFIKKKGIFTVAEANDFLASSGLGYLTEEEIENVKTLFPKQDQMELSSVPEVKNFHNILDYISEQTDLAYEKIYEGYPYMVSGSLRKLEKTLINLGLHTDEKGQQVRSHLNWVRLRCLSDVTKSKDFYRVYPQIQLALDFAKEKGNSELGPTYWMVSALKRLEIITRPIRIGYSKKELIECWEIGQLALKFTSPQRFSEIFVEHLELAKIALVLKNKDNFSRQMDLAFSAVSKLPYQKKYLETMFWDILTRGNLGLEKNIESALDNIHTAKEKSSGKYRAINLFLKNTELQTLLNAKDSAFSILAEKLQDEIKMEAALLNNPYQMKRMKHKRFVGL